MPEFAQTGFGWMDYSTAHEITYERRSGFDRRSGKVPFASRYLLTGRRKRQRRKEDRERYTVPDRFSPKTYIAIFLIMILSVLDAIFTVDLVSKGAAELNPVMAYYLNHGPIVFFWTKYLLTTAAVMIILLNQRGFLHRKLGVNVLFILLIIPFALVVQWELYLIFFAAN